MIEKDIQAKLDELGSAFTAFKAVNDQRLAEIATKGAPSAEIQAAVERSNTDITAIQASLETLTRQQREHETLLARLETLGRPASSAAQDTLRANARAFFAQTRGQRTDPSAEDLASYQAYRQQFAAYLRAASDRGGVSHVPEIRAAMTTGTDPEGGYAVPPDLTGRIVQLITETSPIRQHANIRTTSRREVIGRNDLAEAGGGWTGEVTAQSETTAPTLGQWKIPVNELSAEPRATQDELDDADFDVETWLVQKIAGKLGRLEAAASVSGNGVAKWRGFLTYTNGVPSAAAWNKIEQKKSGANGAFVAAPNGGDVFLDVVGLMKVPYRQGAVWAMNRTTEAAVRKLKDSQGAYIWQPGLQAGIPSQLVGYPVASFEDLPVFSTTGNLAIAFANFGEGYQIVDRRGITLLRDPYTGKPFIKFYTTKRSGGDVVNFEAIKLIQFSA